jgi:predicted site-specific integrase-resolvase
MDSQESTEQRLTRVIQELGSSIRDQARGRWKGVRTAQRKQGSRQVWRFRTGDRKERFLFVPHDAMVQGRDAAEVLMAQLRAERWLDRLQTGPETAYVLSPAGRLKPVPKR